METRGTVCYGALLLFLTLRWASGDFRILGGTGTTIEDHPWAVSFQYLGMPFCGGAIIAPDIVLSAAHCFFKGQWAILMLGEAVAGVTDINHSETGQIRRITKFSIHESYNSTTFDYDIATVKLSEPLQYNSRVKNIRLPESDEKIPDGSALTISGWGVIQAKPRPKSVSNLQSATVYKVSRSYCETALTKYNIFNERMFCAGVPSGEQDTCRGDSGGPIEANGTIYGIVSWGAGCGNPGLPGAYTKIIYFRSWIQEKAGL